MILLTVNDDDFFNLRFSLFFLQEIDRRENAHVVTSGRPGQKKDDSSEFERKVRAGYVLVEKEGRPNGGMGAKSGNVCFNCFNNILPPTK